MHRFNMVDIATKKYKNIMPSDLEVNLKKPNYTIDTLEYISNKLPKIEFSLIIGEDNYKIFDTWKDYDKILNNYKIFIFYFPLINTRINKLDIHDDHYLMGNFSKYHLILP